jgi:hypothetical protein
MRYRNQRKHNRQAILRHRRPGWHPGPTLHKRLPSGLLYSVTPGTDGNRKWHYQTRYGTHVFAPYPPDKLTRRELHIWS